MTLYEKVGKRYRPVREERFWDSWPEGFHLVHSAPGSRATRFKVDPDTVGMLAAVKAKEDAIRKVLYEALYMRPTQRPVTEKQSKAWEAFKQAIGNDGYIVEYESINGIIDRVIEELLK